MQHPLADHQRAPPGHVRVPFCSSQPSDVQSSLVYIQPLHEVLHASLLVPAT